MVWNTLAGIGAQAGAQAQQQNTPYVGTYNEYLQAGGKAPQAAYNANVQQNWGRAAPTIASQGFQTAGLQRPSNPQPLNRPQYSVSPIPTQQAQPNQPMANIAGTGAQMGARLFNQQPQQAAPNQWQQQQTAPMLQGTYQSPYAQMEPQWGGDQQSYDEWLASRNRSVYGNPQGLGGFAGGLANIWAR